MSIFSRLDTFFSSDKFVKTLKNILKQEGYQIADKLDDARYRITNGNLTFEIDTAAAQKSDSDDKLECMLTDLIKTMEADCITEQRLVSFTNSQSSLRFIVMREEDITDNLVYTDFVSSLKKVIVYTPDDIIIHKLDKSYLKKWDVPKEVLISVADRNMCRLMTKAQIHETSLKDEVRVLELSLPSKELCVSLMMCNDFRRVISETFGPKFLVVAPSYESILILENVTNNILEGLGMVIITEYKKAKNPLTTDVILFDPNGINVAGRFSLSSETNA